MIKQRDVKTSRPNLNLPLDYESQNSSSPNKNLFDSMIQEINFPPVVDKNQKEKSNAKGFEHGVHSESAKKVGTRLDETQIIQQTELKSQTLINKD